MCATPALSIGTALFEVVLACLMLWRFRKSTLRNYFVILILLLSAYQITEYMLCTGGNPSWWALAGFATYSFLPAIALDGVSRYVRKPISPFLMYTIPAGAVIIATTRSFIVSATCESPFVSVRHLFNTAQGIGALGNQGDFVRLGGLGNFGSIGILSSYGIEGVFYTLYYGGFMAWTAVLLARSFKDQPALYRQTSFWILAGILLMIVPTFILLLIFPLLNMMFPSVLCRFAVLVAVGSYVGLSLYDQNPS